MKEKALYSRVEELMKEQGLSGYRVSKDLGFSSSFFSEWKNGKSSPKHDKVVKIAEYLGVPVEHIYGDPLKEAYVKRVQREKRKVPVYEVAAGPGRVNEDYPAETIEEVLDDEHSFLIVRGDSMLPVLHDGDLIKVHHQSETSPSDFTVVKINGNETTVKHVEITSDGVWLRAENKAEYEDKFYTIHDVVTLPVLIIGKAVEFKRKL